ncbi:MAG: hypothetical protein L0Z62_12790 [Gemmataceae bacterium]|nr:hypothetical protein [Gemmataceae bacterium]
MMPTQPASVLDRLRACALVGLELALILLIVHRFEVAAQNHFFPILCLAVGGFLVHTWLPARFRAAFFSLLSLGGLLFFLGWPNGAWVIGLGGGLIAIGSLPVPLALRVTLIGLVAFGLSLWRIEFDQPFWPVLGSMFMFRLIIYLYELRRATDRPPLALTLAYFFPLPNICFLFFPILDFKTFRETYRADAPWSVAQSGVRWMAVGLSHLLAYRVIKYYVLPAPHELGDLPHLALFLAANYALYLHVSGYFHLITGIFHLFGFELPRTHHNYFLASSFTDIWRRINIPWKDFMMKVFFFPAFFALRGWGTPVAVASAALWVFLATWLLHAYQVFWITGDLPLSLYDAGLWLVVGVLVAGNLQLDLNRLKPDKETRRTEAGLLVSLSPCLLVSLRTVGMFVLVSIFWACWNTPAVLAYIRAQLAGDRRALAGGAWVLGTLLVVMGALVVVQLARDRLTRLGLLPLRLAPTTSALGLTAGLVAAALIGTPQAAAVFGPWAGGVLAALRHESATPVEAALVVQGYYEEILDARVPTGSWLAALEGRPTPGRSITYTEMTRPADDWLERELIPGWSGEVGGSQLTINHFGMRDRPDRAQKKPADVCRVAVVGSSVVMGYGVGDDEPFPRLLEDGFNARRREGDPRYEILNFGTGRSYVIGRRVLIDRKVFAFEPDAIYYIAHQDEFLGAVRHLAKLVALGHELPYPGLKDVVRQAGITPDTAWGMTEALLQPLARDIVLAIYRDLGAECRQRGIALVWMYVPMPGVTITPVRSAAFVDLATEAGLTVVNLDHWADGYSPTELKLTTADYHPNARGQRLIAEHLDAALRKQPEARPACFRRIED